MPITIVTRGAEVQLMDMLESISEQPVGWQAVHFHLGSLLDQYKSDYQLKIAVNLINDLLKSYDGGVFLMGDSSIIVIAYGMEKTILNKLIFQLRYLYMDDPLAYTVTGQENPDFCDVHDLKRSWKEFFDMAQRRLTAARRPVTPGSSPSDKWIDRASEKIAVDKGILSAFSLAGIERDLTYADLHKVIRRQPVCAVLPATPVRRVFDEIYIHIAQLRQLLKSEVDFLSNRWLFKYLTRILDDRMIELMMHRAREFVDSPISINLNVETLLSKRFFEFDASLKPQSKVSIVLEVPVVDVFADMTAFQLACTEVQKLGYRICIDGLSAASFVSINREKLKSDLVKVQWNADLQSDLGTQANRDMAEAVRYAGTNRVILCRCDNRGAVEYGQALGISLFQGRYLDSVLNPTSKVEN
jgi:EAL domain-containing protein (putative c-di-GMP-specific phosphodiesterase class I)